MKCTKTNIPVLYILSFLAFVSFIVEPNICTVQCLPVGGFYLGAYTLWWPLFSLLLDGHNFNHHQHHITVSITNVSLFERGYELRTRLVVYVRCRTSYMTWMCFFLFLILSLFLFVCFFVGFSIFSAASKVMRVYIAAL